MEINITYDNGLASLAQGIESGIGEIIAAGAQRVCDSAKAACPVDTGALQASISVSAEGNRAIVSADTEYAAYVEFGTSKTAPQPYLVPSLINNGSAVTGAILAAVTGA